MASVRITGLARAGDRRFSYREKAAQLLPVLAVVSLVGAACAGAASQDGFSVTP